jgi:guanylate kinase
MHLFSFYLINFGGIVDYGRLLQYNKIMKNGRLYIISGPSGTGKGTICRSLVNKVPASLSISMTTRASRPQETEGVDYYFVSDVEFENAIEQGGLLEHADVYGGKYGTPKKYVLEKLANGIDVILEIDIQGALQVKANYPDGVFVFILPPSLAELRRRIEARGSESEESINTRMAEAVNEIEFVREYDYYVINDIIENAADKVVSIMRGENLRVGPEIDEVLKIYEAERGLK